MAIFRKDYRLSNPFTANLLAVLISVSISFLVYILMERSVASRVVYVVDNERLFEGFKMTRDLKKEGERLMKAQQVRLDSLNVQFALAERGEQKRQLYEVMVEEKEKMLRFNQAYSSEETAKVWKRIEGYVDDYGKRKQYEVIIGSQTQGDVLYYDKKRDITDDLLSYINRRYEGFN